MDTDLDLINTANHLFELEAFYDEFSYQDKKVYLLPTLHNQVQFSQLVDQLLKEKNIETVLVELPQELELKLIEGIDRLPITSILHNNQLKQKGDSTLVPSKASAYIIHPGESLYWSVFLARRSGIKVVFVDKWHKEAKSGLEIPLGYEHLASIGWSEFFEQSHELISRHTRDVLHVRRSHYMAQKIVEELSSSEGHTLVVMGAAHWPAIINVLRDNSWTGESLVPASTLEQYLHIDNKPLTAGEVGEWTLADIHPHSLHLLTTQLPYYLGNFVEDPEFEMLEMLRQMYFSAEKRYQEKFDDQISPASYRRMFQYLRNLGRLQAMILPDLYNLIAGAKGMVDDDYAFEVYRRAISYPFLPSEDEKLDEMLKFTPDESQGEVIRFAFKRRIKRPVLKKMDRDEYDDLDPIPEEDYEGQWGEIWDKLSPYGYVSYPPEDEFIENYMQFLRKRIIEILMEEESATFEFESSLEDGIDWRETMRHYHEGKIFVKQFPRNKYTVGALIVQFLEEPYDTDEYAHHSTLFAEHEKESHISVITTRPGDVMVGPGISRVKYAAIISQFPPVAMPYLISKENIDLKLKLIWTAINMSLNKIIGFVAKKPPTAAQRHFAAEHGYRLVFLPMGQLTAASLHRLRTMHLLAHRDLRDIAREYIGF